VQPSPARPSPFPTASSPASRAGRAYDGFVSSLLRAKRRRAAASARPRIASARGDRVRRRQPLRP
jgi:hypothetical protein